MVVAKEREAGTATAGIEGTPPALPYCISALFFFIHFSACSMAGPSREGLAVRGDLMLTIGHFEMELGDAELE